MKAARTIALCALLLLAVAGADARKAGKAFAPAPAPAPATAEDALLESAAIMRAAAEAGFELTPEELAMLEAETGAAPAPAPEEIPARRLLSAGEHHHEAVAAPAPAPATEDALLEGAAIMRAVQEAGFELTPEELAMLEAETAAAPAPAVEAEPAMMRRLLEEEVAAAPAPATEDALLEGAAIMRAVQEAGFELTPEELAMLEAETAAAPAPAEAEPAVMRRLLQEEVAAAPAPATEDALLEGAAIMRAVQEAGFELTPEELAMLEAETAAAPAPATAEPAMMRRLLEEEVAAAPAPATEDALLEGAAIMRAVQEAGFELTPEELAMLEAETAAAPAPATESEPAAMRRLLEEEVAAAPAPATAEDALLEGAAIMRAVQEAGFELTPEELAMLEAETTAAPAPAPEA